MGHLHAARPTVGTRLHVQVYATGPSGGSGTYSPKLRAARCRHIDLLPQPCRRCFGGGKQLVVLQDVIEIDEPTAAVAEGGDAMTAIAIRPEAVGLFERMHFAAS